MPNQTYPYPHTLWRIDHTDVVLSLITPEEFEHLDDGTKLVSIRGEVVIKGKDKIGQDTRYGFLAFGFKSS